MRSWSVVHYIRQAKEEERAKHWCSDRDTGIPWGTGEEELLRWQQQYGDVLGGAPVRE